MASEKHYWLYVLKLEKDKYYVGITTQTPEIRFNEHKNQIRSAYWTMKYKPIEIIDRRDLGFIKRDAAEAIENKEVRRHMKEKGYNNVRGGDLTSQEDYKILFGYVYDYKDWDAMRTVAVLVLIMFIMTILYYMK